MSIAAGLSATKTGFDLIKSLREVLGKPDVNPGDIQARLVELQSLMLDAQRALSDAEEDNRKLSKKLAEAYEANDLKYDMHLVRDGGFYIRRSEGEIGATVPYCPVCWQVDNKTVPLESQTIEGSYWCFVHKHAYRTKEAARRVAAQRDGW